MTSPVRESSKRRCWPRAAAARRGAPRDAHRQDQSRLDASGAGRPRRRPRAPKEVLAARRRLLGEEHPDTLTGMNNLASTLYAQGDLAGALRPLEEEQTRAGLLGEEHPRWVRDSFFERPWLRIVVAAVGSRPRRQWVRCLTPQPRIADSCVVRQRRARSPEPRSWTCSAATRRRRGRPSRAVTSLWVIRSTRVNNPARTQPRLSTKSPATSGVRQFSREANSPFIDF